MHTKIAKREIEVGEKRREGVSWREKHKTILLLGCFKLATPKIGRTLAHHHFEGLSIAGLEWTRRQISCNLACLRPFVAFESSQQLAARLSVLVVCPVRSIGSSAV